MAPDPWASTSWGKSEDYETIEQLDELDLVTAALPSLKAAAVPATKTEPSRDARRQQQMAELSRDEVLRRVRMKQSLKRAGLSGVDLSGASLEGVDLSRAELDGANFENAKLSGANLKSASLRGANLRGADLSRADLERADLENANLSAAKLDAANLARASLEGATLDGARLSGTKLGGASFAGARHAAIILEWIDVSASADGSERLEGPKALAFLTGRRESIAPAARYFGRGDVMRDATLVFDAGSVIQIDSRFENCSITLGDGAELTIGEPGILHNCQIVGGGKITVHGRFFERSSPGIAGAKSVVVSSLGAVVGGIEQAPDSTVFAFEPGSRLRVKILRPRERLAAE